MGVRIAVETRQLTKAYRSESGNNTTVFRDIDLEIQEGEFVAIIGPSGSGKTTLLETIAGLREATSGKVLVYGKEENFPTADKGVVFQRDAVFPWRTVLRNVTYGLELRGIPREEREETARRYIEMVGLSGYEKFYPKELSGGMKKRLAIAAVFANNPRILLMDEPFGSLDYTTKVELQTQLLEIWQQHRKTVLFVTHDLEEALFLSMKIIVIRENRLFKIVSVPFGFPRDSELRLNQNFRVQLNSLWNDIQ